MENSELDNNTEIEKGFKRCSKCGQIKPISEFYKRKSSKDGLYSYCKQCDKSMKAYYYQTHKGKIKAYKAEWLAKHPNYNAEYYKANKEKAKAYNAEYQANYTDPQKNPLGFARHMVAHYRKMDRDRGFDDSQTITAEWFVQNIMYKHCAHCGLRQVGAIGANRLNNDLGHEASNLEPCCKSCNCKENIRDQFERGTHISQIWKKQSFKNFLKELKAKDKTD